MNTLDFPLKVKSLTDEGTFEGYGSIFGNVDSYSEKVAPGAFIESLTKGRREGSHVKMLWNHDPMQPIGVWEDLAEDSKGLWGKGRLILEVPKARETHALMKAGAIGGLSIGYREQEADQDGNVRVLKKLDLMEISPVTFPANTRAKITGVKSEALIGAEILEKLKAGDRLTEREWGKVFKGLDLSNSQAERAVRVHFKGRGEPVATANGADFLSALLKNFDTGA